MEFDAIVGNPPYQVMDGGSKASATPLYNYFVEQAKEIAPKYLSMIMPAKWFSGGRGLDQFRDNMLHDDRTSKLIDYADANVCFPGVDIAGGICYFLWDKCYHGTCEFTNIHQSEVVTHKRALDCNGPFVRYNKALSITEKVAAFGEDNLSSHVSSQKPFGLRTYVKQEKTVDLLLRFNGGKGPFPLEKVEVGIEWIDKWKVIMSYLTYDHAGLPDKDGKRRIFSTMEVLPPATICTETYLLVDVFESEEEARNLLIYLKTKFARFLVSQIATTQHISKSSFGMLPVQDFTKVWDDSALYEKYGLTQDEIKFIDSMIKPME
jgi:site-specific DNA-methyltransferase (adenine-specific)